MIKNFALYVLIGLALIVSLSGCSQGHIKGGSELLTVNLPIVTEYDPAVMANSAAETKGGSCPALSVLAVDYGQMRDETRVLLGEDVDITR